MGTSKTKKPDNAARDERNRILSEYATDRLFEWLTAAEQEGRIREYLRQVAAVLRGRIRPETSSRDPQGDAFTMSQTILSVTATRLSSSFGVDACDRVYTQDTWPGSLALAVAVLIDWRVLADRLLRKYVPEYPDEPRSQAPPGMIAIRYVGRMETGPTPRTYIAIPYTSSPRREEEDE